MSVNSLPVIQGVEQAEPSAGLNAQLPEPLIAGASDSSSEAAMERMWGPSGNESLPSTLTLDASGPTLETSSEAPFAESQQKPIPTDAGLTEQAGGKADVEAGLLYTSAPRLITLPSALLAAHKPGFVPAQENLPLPPVEPGEQAS